MATAYVSLGSNLGNPIENLKRALGKIEALPGIVIVKYANIYLTEPLDCQPGTPWFYNTAIKILCERMPPGRLLKCLQKIEKAEGRAKERTRRNGEKYSSRTIDLDILIYDNYTIETPNLVIPHPRLYQRAFFLLPLSDICRADFLLPNGKNLKDALSLIDYHCTGKIIFQNDEEKCGCGN